VGPGKRIKVTPEQEDTIRRLKIEGKKVAAIARAVGLSRPAIYAVLIRIPESLCPSLHIIGVADALEVLGIITHDA
jgi:hypothetical protein